MCAAVQQNYAAWAAGFAPAAMGNPGRPELAEQFAAGLASLRPDIALATMRVIFQLDRRADLPKVRPRTWILQSSRDIAVPQSVGRYLQQRIAGSHYQELDAEGHFPHISAPQAVNQAIQIALDNNERSRPDR